MQDQEKDKELKENPIFDISDISRQEEPSKEEIETIQNIKAKKSPYKKEDLEILEKQKEQIWNRLVLIHNVFNTDHGKELLNTLMKSVIQDKTLQKYRNSQSHEMGVSNILANEGKKELILEIANAVEIVNKYKKFENYKKYN